MYSIIDFGDMIADKGRMDPYVTALRQAVDHESVVLDIGAGTGIFALLACHFGAKKVYAVEPNDTIQVAKDLALANGYLDRIEIIQDLSTKVNLPELANIVISDLRGSLPLYHHHIPSIIDARTRLLAPGGVLIPAQDTLFAAVAESHDLYERISTPWKSDEFGVDMKPVLSKVMNTMWGSKISKERMLTEPRPWVTINYNTVQNPDVSGELKWIAENDGIAHGLRIWFDAEIAPGLGFSNAPDQPEHVYRNIFFPLMEPVSLKSGDGVSIKLQANLVGNEYIWRWTSTIYNNNDTGNIKASFEQSSFIGTPVSLVNLRKREASFKPVLNNEGLVDLQVLSMMEQGLSLEVIAGKIAERFPDIYKDIQQALAHVGELSLKFSK